MSVKLKASTASSTKISRSLEDKIKVLSLVINGGMKKREAFVEIFGETMSKAMGKYPHSIYDQFYKSIEGKVEKGDQETITLLQQYDLGEESTEE